MQSNRLSFWRPSRLPYIAVSDLVPPPVVVMATTGTCSTQQGRRSESHACISDKHSFLLQKSDKRLQVPTEAVTLLCVKRMWLLQKASVATTWLMEEGRLLSYPRRSGGREAVYLIYNWKSTSSPWNSSLSVLLEAIIANTGFTTPEQISDPCFCL